MIGEPLDAAGVATVLAIKDPVLRNLWITQSYFELNTRLQRAVGGADRTWCGFAVWASDTAGQSIRGDVLPQIVVDIVDADPEHHADVAKVNRRMRPLRAVRAGQPLGDDALRQAVRDAMGHVSYHIAHGNTLVYGELGPLLVAFVEHVERGEGDDVASITAADVQQLLVSTTGGPIDPKLGEAFEWWRQAVVTSDEQARAFAVLAGNVMAVAHEQERLQDDIAAAMNAGLFMATRVVDRIMPWWVPWLVERLVAALIGEPLRRIAARTWRQLLTDVLMTLRVPGAVLRLGRDIPPMADGSLFPAVLATLLDTPEQVANAVAIYRAFDRTGGSGLHDAVEDWAVLTQRMSYIVNLFRGRQRDPSFDAHPFNDVQLAAMRQGRVPNGSLVPPGAS